MLSILSLLRFETYVIYVIFITFLIVIDFVSYKLIVNLLVSKYKVLTKVVKALYILISLSVYTVVTWAFFFHKWPCEPINFSLIFDISGNIFALYNPKILFIICFLLYWLFRKVNQSFARIFIQIAGFFCILLIFILLWGNYKGRFIYRVQNIELKNNLLPQSFDGLKIVQFSDIHLGTYIGHEEKIAQIVDLINAQHADVVIYTGDLTNCFAEEIPPFIKCLSKIQAKNAKYAVLGNHDYGDYYKWKNKTDHINNHKLQIGYYSQMGFQLLQNEHVKLARKSDTIIVAGIENWGKKPYRQEGDLDEALSSVSDSAFVLLLSHDPSFWDEKVVKKKNIRYTFSGHTHGYQIGIKINNFEWSPFQFGQKRVAGMYENNGQYLYINRGLGGALYPGRVGIFSEITVFTLKSGS